MNEQQRIFLSVSLCMAIWLGWNAFFGPPPEPAQVTPTASTAPAHPISEPPTETRAQRAMVAPSRRAPRATQTFATGAIKGVVREGDAAFTELVLVDYDERADGNDTPASVSMVPPGGTQASVSLVLDADDQVDLRFVPDTPLSLFGVSDKGLHVALTLTPRRGDFAIGYQLRIENPTQASRQVGAQVMLQLTPLAPAAPQGGGASLFSPLAGLRNIFAAAPSDPLHALCEVKGSLQRKDQGDLKKGPFQAPQGASWAALDRQYFVAAIVPDAALASTTPEPVSLDGCLAEGRGEALRLNYSLATQALAPQGTWQRNFVLYAGPKRDSDLSRVSHKLQDVVDYTLARVPLGFLARPMVFILNMLFDLTHSWGVSIIGLTFIVKLILFPVNVSSMRSIKRMQGLKPEIDKIKQRYKNDAQKQQEAQLALFKARKVNPVGGCLPMLLQMPVWLTLYRTLWSAVDLYKQSFLWLPDLTAKEPFPFLALAVGAVTVLQQRLTPMGVDNQQAKVMMWVLPVMLTVFMIALPSGLVLYILVNSILTIAQQLAINGRTHKAATS